MLIVLVILLLLILAVYSATRTRRRTRTKVAGDSSTLNCPTLMDSSQKNFSLYELRICWDAVAPRRIGGSPALFAGCVDRRLRRVDELKTNRKCFSGNLG